MKRNYFQLLNLSILTAGVLFHSIIVNAQTLSVDNLIKVGNDSGHGSFTLSNYQREAIYVDSEVLQIKVVDGQIKKIPLTRDNFPIWDLAVNPSKLRLLPQELRDVAVKYLCQTDCDRSRDLVYQVRFSPITPPEESDEQKVSFTFGVAPYYIVPALEPEVDYTWEYNEAAQIVRVRNTGNTYLKVEFDNCNDLSEVNSCRATYHILAGRKMDIKLPEGVQGNNVQVTVADHDQRNEDEFTL